MNETAHQNSNDILFESNYKEVWRKLIPPGLTEAEADFIEEIAELEQGGSVLDIMCGYGRHSIELARRGYHATAIDNLPSYIQEIKERAQAENLSITALMENVGSTTFSGKYDAAICMGNCFTAFDYPRAINVLTNISSCLAYGGILIINSWMIAEIVIKHFEEKTWLYVDEFKYLLDNKYLFQPSRIETDHILIAPDGRTEVLKGVDYIFSFAELEAMLNKTGFKLKDVYATPRKKKFRFGDNKAYIVAERV